MTEVSAAVPPRPSGARGAIGRLERALPALVVALTAVLALRRLDNTDTWWHLAGGRWIATHGSIPSNDPLSWTVRDHAWTNIQWLFDVLMYWVYRLGGPSLTVIASATVYSAAVALLLVNLRRYVGPIPAALLGAWAVIISQSRFAIRPEMMSYLMLQVILWLYATGRAADRKRLWLLPAVMCLFANLHSLFIVGAVVIVCQMAGALLSQAPFLPAGWRRPVDRRVRSRILATGVAALAATVVNPFFLRGATFPFVLMTELSGRQPFIRGIGELRRPFDSYFVTFSLKAYRLFFFFALAVLVAALIVTASRSSAMAFRDARRGRRRNKRRKQPGGGHRPGPASHPIDSQPTNPSERAQRLDLGDVAVLVGVGYLSLLARRNIALFAIAGGPALASCLSVLAARRRAPVFAANAPARRALVVALAFLLTAACWFVATNGYYKWNKEHHEFGLGVIDMNFPTRAAAFMKEQKLPGPLFNDFTNGGYFSWAEPIPGGVYVDGRVEVYGAEFLARYGRQVQRPEEWQAEMDRRGVQTATLFHWWPNHQTLLRFLLTDDRWGVVYYDETTVVAVRKEGNMETIARASAAFVRARETTERMLLAPERSWQWQIARARGLTAYANLLAVMGRSDEVRRMREFLARLNLRRG